jgi:hypothetical protein
MKHRKLAVAALALLMGGALLPGWSHATEAAGPTTLAAPASCPANDSILAPLPNLAPWSAPSALDSSVCSSTCGDVACRGQAFYSLCPSGSSTHILVCWPGLQCPLPAGGTECLCQPPP